MKPTSILSLLAAGVLGSIFSGATAHATFINGTIQIAGNITLNGSFSTATAFTSFTPVAVTFDSGSFVTGGVVPLVTPVTTSVPSGFTFLPAQSPSPINGLWSSGIFSFNLASITDVHPNSSVDITLVGTGTITGTGFTNTAGIWSFSSTNVGSGTFSFQSGTAANAPDGGSTVALLGFVLMGVEGLRRKLRA